MASPLRTAVLWCCRLDIAWSTEDVAAMASCDTGPVRAFLVQLERRGVVSRMDGDQWRAGDPTSVKAYRLEQPNPKLGGGGKAYRRAKAVRERLLCAEAAARRTGGLLPPHCGASPSTPAQTTISSDGLLRPALAAELLGVHVCTLKRWAGRGYLRLVAMPSGQHRVPTLELARLLDLRSSPLHAAVAGTTT